MNLKGIIYVASIILLQVIFLAIKKTDKKINLFMSIGISIVLIMCFNAFICYCLTFFNINCSFINLTLINIILAVILFIVNKIKKVGFQKYELNKMDVFSTIAILIVTIVVTFANFRLPFNIKYESSDPSCHYLTSLKFMKEEKLLSISKDDLYGSFTCRKFASYVNSGLLMKCFEGKIDYIDNYKIFIAFGIFILFLTGYLLYFILDHFAKDDKSKILALIISILCIIGYPLNSLLFGFEYMSLSFTVILAIIEIIYLINKSSINKGWYITILFLLNFGLFCSYFMFVPFVYPAEWIYLCINSYKKDKKIVTKSNIATLTITLLIPFFLGYIYHLAPSIYQVLINNNALEGDVLETSKNIIDSGFNTDGYIYTDLYSNFILLLPLSLYIVIRKFKENKFMSFMFIFNVIFIIILLIGRAFDRVSYYYLSKNYFTLWITMFILNFRALMYIYEKHKIIPFTLTGIYIAILVLYLIFVPTVLKNEKVNSHENLLTVMDIYGINKYVIFNKQPELTNKEIELIKTAIEIIPENSEFVFVSNAKAIAWSYPLTGKMIENKTTQNVWGQTRIDYTYLNLREMMLKADYAIVLKQDNSYYLTRTEYFNNYKILYETDLGCVAINTNPDKSR